MHGFQIGLAGEVGRHGAGLATDGAAGIGGAAADESEEVALAEGAVIGGTEEPAAGLEEAQARGDEFVEVLFNAEDAALVVTGEGGGIEDNAVPCAILCGKSPEPLGDIAFAEEVGGGVEGVEGEVALSPFERRAGEVDAGGDGSARRGDDAEGAGVGEQI